MFFFESVCTNTSPIEFKKCIDFCGIVQKMDCLENVNKFSDSHKEYFVLKDCLVWRTSIDLDKNKGSKCIEFLRY